MRLITNLELQAIGGGGTDHWVTIYVAEDSYSDGANGGGGGQEGGGGGGSAAPITIKTFEGCDQYYPLPGGKEWNTTCKTDVRLADAGVGEYPQYNPDWRK